MSQAAVTSSSLRCCLGGKRVKKMKFDDRSLRLGMAAFAFVIVAIIGTDALLRMLGTATEGRCFLAHFVSLMDKWQTLITGLLTLLTAGFAAQYVVAQMRLTQELDDSKNSRSRRAWLAMMPQTMSEVCSYAKNSFRELQTIRGALSPNSADVIDLGDLPAPDLSESVFSDIKSMVEASNSEIEAKHFAELLSLIQVHRSRWNGIGERLEGKSLKRQTELLELEMTEATELYARASNIISRSRPNPPQGGYSKTTRAEVLLIFKELNEKSSLYKIVQRTDATYPIPYLETEQPPRLANH